jgi:hypothetical protein
VKTLAEAIREEEAALTRRFIYFTSKRTDLTLAEAMCLSERMAETRPEEKKRANP